jgi:glycosyltransferase involved in cell wall biosynthesis
VDAGSRGTSLLFVNQHYHPDVASTGQHLTDLAEYLAAHGLGVEVLTGRGRYVAGTLPAPAREVRNGVTITRVRSTAFGRASHVGRLVDYFTFYVRVLARLTGRRRYDGVVFLTTPPLMHVLGRLARLTRGQRYGIWSMDLHPEAEIASGMLRAGGVLARALSWANRVGYRGADFVVDLGRHMRRRILEMGVDQRRTYTVRVWSRAEEIEPVAPESNPLRAELGLDGAFVVMYSGNAGIVHDFDAILEAMRLLKDDPTIYFLFVGNGPQRPRIEAHARAHRLRNFRYLDYVGRDRLRYSLSVGDAHLISLRAPFVGVSVPGKLYGIMAAGRPALFVGPAASDTGETIVEAGCGAVVDPRAEDAGEQVARVLRSWRDDPAAARRLGAAGRRAFLADYERVPNCAAFLGVIEGAWAPQYAPRPATTARAVF